MTPMQRAVVLTAMEKAIKKANKKARELADADVEELYRAFGTDRVKVHLGDLEIGTFTVILDAEGYEVDDPEAFRDFMVANGLAEVRESIKPAHMAQAVSLVRQVAPDAIEETIAIPKESEALIKRVGDSFVVDGTSETIPGISPRKRSVNGTRLTGCKAEEVIPALNALSGNVMEELLLGGGTDE